MSEDVVNVNDIGSSDYYLKQLTKLSNKEIDKKEIPNLVKQQLKIIKDQYKIGVSHLLKLDRNIYSYFHPQ